MKRKEPVVDDIPENNKGIVPVTRKGKTKRAASRTTFTRLIKKIGALKDNIDELPEREKMIVNFYEEKARPLFERESALKYDLLTRLDAVYDTARLSVKNRDTLAFLILEESDEVVDLHVQRELREKMEAIREKYEDIVTGLSREKREQGTIRDMLEELPLFGIHPDDGMRSAGSMQEFIAAFEHVFFSQAEEGNSGSGSDTRTGKLSGKGGRQKRQEELAMKSIREIYVELVKRLHPDREADAVVRMQKEECMKIVTEAYRNKDLASLLNMQADWLEGAAVRSGEADEDSLKNYNRILRSQLKCLEEEYAGMCQAPFPEVEGGYAFLREYPLVRLKEELELMHEAQLLALEEIEKYVQSVSTLSGLRRRLKQFEKEIEEDDLWEDAFFSQMF